MMGGLDEMLMLPDGTSCSLLNSEQLLLVLSNLPQPSPHTHIYAHDTHTTMCINMCAQYESLFTWKIIILTIEAQITKRSPSS